MGRCSVHGDFSDPSRKPVSPICHSPHPKLDFNRLIRWNRRIHETPATPFLASTVDGFTPQNTSGC